MVQFFFVSGVEDELDRTTNTYATKTILNFSKNSKLFFNRKNLNHLELTEPLLISKLPKYIVSTGYVKTNPEIKIKKITPDTNSSHVITNSHTRAT